jgi:hypothetical protein
MKISMLAAYLTLFAVVIIMSLRVKPAMTGHGCVCGLGDCADEHIAINHKNHLNHPKIIVQTKALKGRHQQHRATPCDMYAVVERKALKGRHQLLRRRITPFQGLTYAWTTDIHRALPCAIDARALPLCAAISRPANNHNNRLNCDFFDYNDFYDLTSAANNHKNHSNHPKITVRTKATQANPTAFQQGAINRAPTATQINHENPANLENLNKIMVQNNKRRKAENPKQSRQKIIH